MEDWLGGDSCFDHARIGRGTDMDETQQFIWFLGIDVLPGIISAEVKGKRVKLELTEPHSLKLDEKISIEGKELTLSNMNTGVPHAISFLKNVENVDVVNMGRMIRFHPHYAPAAANANFVKVEKSSRLSVRTYEREVEDETLACETGAVASTLVAAFKRL